MALFPLICFAVLCAFLACLGLFALAVTKVVAPDGRGHARSFAGTCAAALALMLLLGLGMTGLAATVAAIGLGSVSSWNPIERIEISRAPARESGFDNPREDPRGPREGRRDDREEHDDEHAVAARFTVRGDAGPELVELLHGMVDVDLDELGDNLTVQHLTDADGAEFSVYEFRLPISERELARFEKDVRHELDGLKVRLPERVDIQFESAERESD